MSIQRITCFKVSDPKDIPSFQDGYRVLQETNQKVRICIPHPFSFPYPLPFLSIMYKNILDQFPCSPLSSRGLQDGKPYILTVTSGPTTATDDARAQGYNFIALARFSSEADVQYYDDECEAHRRYKEFAKGKIGGPPLTVMVRV